MNVFAVIPAHNEEKTVANVVKRAKKYCSVIVVDDGSSDRTAELSKKSGATVIRHEEKSGYGKSLMDGINEALRRRARIIITLDSDGQHNPDDIPRFMNALNEGYDIVSGSRFLGRSRWGTWKRQLAIRALTFQAFLFSGLRITDIQSGFRAYNAKVFRKIKLENYGMGFSVELPIKAKKKGFKFKDIPIDIGRPHRIKSLWSVLRQGIQVGFAIMKYSLV
jgi:glycosyltransferase involved in cell wall biosynthesis